MIIKNITLNIKHIGIVHQQSPNALIAFCGGIILCLMIYRFRLRLANTVIPSAALKPYERIWSVRTHLTMYALVLLMVLSGIGQGIFFEQEVRIFGFINITLEHNESIVVIFHFIHETTANIFKLLIAIHILAALKHQFIDRNGLLKRMR